MSVVGVDFGAKNSLIAAAGRGGVDVILNGNSNRQNPCLVSFGECRKMGEGASANATSTVSSMKRLVGLSFDDPRAQREMARLPFKCFPMKHSDGNVADTIGVKVNINNEPTSVGIEHVAGMMVKHLGEVAAHKAASASNDPAATKASLFPSDWVVAIPGYYTDAQRRAFLVGCEVVGLKNVQRLMHETTATALAYGIFKDIRKEFSKTDGPTNVMFIDFGATAYQASIVAFESGKLLVKSSHYDSDLGGRDFDALIAEWIADQFETKYKNKLSGPVRENKKVMLKLSAAAEKAKKTLSPAGVKEVRINIECLMDDLDFAGTLQEKEYEAMTKPLLDRLEAPIARCLEEAKLQPKDLSSVEIVGGSSRISSVKKRIAEVLKLDTTLVNMGLSTTMNADEAVCRGAALQSAILSPRFKVLPYEIVENQPYPVNIAWDGSAGAADEGVEVEGEVEGSNIPTNAVVMFERGSNFPCVRRVTLRRSGEFLVRATYDESAKFFPDGADRQIATFKIAAPDGVENKVRVNVKQEVHGTITLSSAQLVEEVMEEEVTPDVEMKDTDPAKNGKETEESKEGESKEKSADVAADPPAKKKKVKKTNLQFQILRPVEWSKTEKDAAYELEVQMTNADRVVQETADTRNELESYLYSMRDKIISELSSFCTDDDRSKFSSALENAENWLYEDGFDAGKSVLADKLKEVKKLGDPIQLRKVEAVARPSAVSALQRTVEQYKTFLNACSSDEKYSHITVEEQGLCHSKCDEVSSWMYDMLDKQGSLPASADPVVTVAQINLKSKELTAVVSPIMKKPVPKPPKVEEKKAAAADKKENGSEPMDIDTGEPAAPKDPKEGGEPMQTE
mmetsp:Transcript_6615/g.9662  ORF Transcript_6615/g.9662 Transcript_6615/m.9662 type:complete len:852 (+) Transcript_6615:80-2635(+)|eukprot:CAMPEP_0195519350 /NCGR_PEP_ID=MMETSP0794_2-20130614/14591_1 /TAXON_ID=515487 /ORGANISM="Stephanopyxis turris, Strain CCMP 815" /LENGTH=851 /DNA_ID=CAMNT_0040648483 /DNA_START=66 /DNA_END=2621 /DNA_ORIENTATION=-